MDDGQLSSCAGQGTGSTGEELADTDNESLLSNATWAPDARFPACNSLDGSKSECPEAVHSSCGSVGSLETIWKINIKGKVSGALIILHGLMYRVMRASPFQQKTRRQI